MKKIINYVADYMLDKLSKHIRNEYFDSIEFVKCEKVSANDKADDLTLMRQHMTVDVNTRIVISGKISSYIGYAPAILEEAVLAMKNEKPLYVVGAFGGAAQKTACYLSKNKVASIIESNMCGYGINDLNNRFNNKENEQLSASRYGIGIIALILRWRSIRGHK